MSTKATACPHCGCPVEEPKSTICIVRDIPYDLGEVLKLAILNDGTNHDQEGIELLQQIVDAPLDEIFAIWTILKHKKEIPHDIFSPKESAKRAATERAQFAPKCPTCGSTSLDKINAFGRGVAGGLFGFASKTARSQFRCKKCGYMF